MTPERKAELRNDYDMGDYQSMWDEMLDEIDRLEQELEQDTIRFMLGG